jgi:hypothetical protein
MFETVSVSVVGTPCGAGPKLSEGGESATNGVHG